MSGPRCNGVERIVESDGGKQAHKRRTEDVAVAMRHLPFCRPCLIRFGARSGLPTAVATLVGDHPASSRPRKGDLHYFFFAVFFEAFFFFEALAALRFLAMSVTSFLGVNTTRWLEPVKTFFAKFAQFEVARTTRPPLVHQHRIGSMERATRCGTNQWSPCFVFTGSKSHSDSIRAAVMIFN